MEDQKAGGVVEVGASEFSQSASTRSLTGPTSAQGYKQGGLGVGGLQPSDSKQNNSTTGGKGQLPPYSHRFVRGAPRPPPYPPDPPPLPPP